MNTLSNSVIIQNTKLCGQITMQNISLTKTHETVEYNNIIFFSNFFPPL